MLKGFLIWKERYADWNYLVFWPWRVAQNPKTACLYLRPLLSILLGEKPLVWRKCDPSTTQPYVHTPLHHPPTSVSPKSPPTTSGFQFPVSCSPYTISDRVWGTWHRPQYFPKRPNNKLPDPHRAEWHIFPSPQRSVYRVLRIQLCIWNSLCTVCSKSVTGKHTGAAAGGQVHFFF